MSVNIQACEELNGNSKSTSLEEVEGESLRVGTEDGADTCMTEPPGRPTLSD